MIQLDLPQKSLSISPQLLAGSANAQFGKTQFFLDTLYINALCGLIIGCFNASTSHTATLCKSTLKQENGSNNIWHRFEFTKYHYQWTRDYQGEEEGDFRTFVSLQQGLCPTSPGLEYSSYILLLCWVPCPVICLACVLAGPDWRDSLPFYMLPLSEVVKNVSTNQLQSLPSPPPLIHAAPTSVARFAFRRLTRNLMPKTDLNLEAWLHFGIHTFTLSFQRIPFKWAKAKTQNNLYWGSVERGGSTFIIFVITLNFHSASFKGNDFVCFLKLENKIWAYRRQTASTINSALQIHVLKLQLRRKCKKH